MAEYLSTVESEAGRFPMKSDLGEMLQQSSGVDADGHPLKESGRKPNPWLELLADGADIQKKQLPPLVEIVKGIVGQHSKLAIVSSAKCFKSWLSIDLALAVSHGLKFLDRVTVRSRVLYVNLELKPDTFERRVQAIAKALKIEIEEAWFQHLPLRGHMAELSVHEIIDRIVEIAKKVQAEVIVIDPVFKLNVEGEENSSRDQTLLFNEIDRLTTEGKCTVVLNDHAGKGNQSEKDPLDVIRGSSAKGGDLDAAMVLRKHDVRDCFRVDLVHRELPPVEPFVLGWNYPLMQLRPDLSPDQMKKAKGGREREYDPLDLPEVIKKTTAKRPISISAWAAAAGVKRPTLVNYLSGMRSKGWIATVGEGNTARQHITKQGREILKERSENV
jgi:hypothetical protein